MPAEQSSSADEQKPTPARKTIPGVALRIILVLVTGIIIGAIVYFSAVGWIPYVEQRVFEPIKDNQDQLQILEATQQNLQGQLTDLSATLAILQSDTNQGLQATLTVLITESAWLNLRSDEMEGSLEELTFLSATDLPARLATLEAHQESSANNLSALATAQMRDFARVDETYQLRILDLFSRATQFLLHDNYGLAEDQLLVALDLVEELELSGTADDPQLTAELIDQISGVIADLPARPDLAEIKLELAWQLALSSWDTKTSGTVTPTPIQPTPSPGNLTPTPN